MPQPPTIPVLLGTILGVLRRQGKRPSWSRRRALAALAAALAVPCGLSLAAFCRMQPSAVLQLLQGRSTPPVARRRVRQWIAFRANQWGLDDAPWLATPGSRPVPAHIAFACTRLLVRRAAPAWRLRALLDGPRWAERVRP